MARPQKQTVDYFPHDANASDGDTLTILQSRFGNDGYAFWFKLLEKISTSENHVINCRNPVKWQLLLAKTSVDEEKGLAIMELLCELEAIDAQLWRDSKIIWCQNLVNNVADVYKNRSRPMPERPIPTADNLVLSKETPVSTPDNTQSKVNKTKVNKTKLQSISQKFEIFWKAYPKRKSRGQAEKAFAKINPDEQLLATMLATIERAKRSSDWQKDDGKYIPYPATWLNAKGWEDEFPDKGGQGGAHRQDTSTRGRFGGFKAIESGPDETGGRDED